MYHQKLIKLQIYCTIPSDNLIPHNLKNERWGSSKDPSSPTFAHARWSHSGFMYLLIDKPKDWTSHDVVAKIRGMARKETGIKKIKVGHAGTLDPFATGLLIVGIGRDATKRLDEFKALPKTYVATLKLGATSDTQDSTGVITKTPGTDRSRPVPSPNDIKNILQNFVGKQEQIPPMYSAKKVGGKKLYDLARKGIEIERKPIEIEIYDIKLLDYNYPDLKIEVECSTGTYIRTLANDIGKKIGCGAYCDELRRTRIGEYDVGDAKAPYSKALPLSKEEL
ncbi:MAG: tRNA pseudouridine(55) synthase TruB [Candidatus Magasanikbacteria bacterium]